MAKNFVQQSAGPVSLRQSLDLLELIAVRTNPNPAILVLPFLRRRSTPPFGLDLPLPSVSVNPALPLTLGYQQFTPIRPSSFSSQGARLGAYYGKGLLGQVWVFSSWAA